MFKLLYWLTRKIGLYYLKQLDKDNLLSCSLRWRGFGWDYVKHPDKRFFIQYGSNPIKYAAVFPAGTKLFTFLRPSSYTWIELRRFKILGKLFVFGSTKRPLPISLIPRPDKMKPSRRGKCHELVENLS